MRNEGPDQDQDEFENLGPSRTGQLPNLLVRASLIAWKQSYIDKA